MSKIIVISPDIIGKNMAGPGIRYLNISIQLSKRFDVVLFTPNDPDNLNFPFKVAKISKHEILEEEKDGCKCILLQGLTLWRNPFLKKLGIPLVVDLYDPFILENMEQFKINSGAQYKASLSVLLDQLKYGDFFICASEKQKDFWIGMLCAINRINPIENNICRDFSHLIDVVPFGIESTPPIKNRSVIKGVMNGINKEDHVVLWGGGIWDWLDPFTVIKAMSILKSTRKDIKLLFMGVEPPNQNGKLTDTVAKAINLSESMNLKNINVFFNKWVEYDDRHNYYLEADVGVNSHFDHLETRFSFRTRILDYIWCSLPILSTRGDILSEYIEKYNIGIAVIPGNPELVAEALCLLVDNSTKYKNNFEHLQKKFTWEVAVQPLVKFCNDPKISLGKNESLKIKGTSKGYYYFAKVMSLVKTGDYKTIFFKIKKIYNK